MGWIGYGVQRAEDPRLLTGRGRYLDDILLPGMLHMAVLRSPHAHAVLRRIDKPAALRVSAHDSAGGGPRPVYSADDRPSGRTGAPSGPDRDAVRSRRNDTEHHVGAGVAAIIAAHDVRHLGELPVLAEPPHQRQSSYPVLPSDRVRYVGQPVAAVAAATRYAAEDALDLIDVEYDPLPAVTDVDRAMDADAPRLYDWPDNRVVWREIVVGDVDAAFAGAHVVVGGMFTIPRQTACPLEGRGAVASWDAGAGSLTLWVSNQAPHQYRTVLASVLGLDEGRIRIVVPDVGGGFGAKLHYYPEEVLACVLAMRLGRPVKWVDDRREHFLGMVHAREQRIRARAAFSRDGRLLALDAHIRGDVGAHLHTKGVSPIFVTASMLPNAYDVAHYRARVEAVVTNKVPFGAYRAFGMQQSAFVIERLMDMGAHALGLDPAEIRRRNLIAEAAFPYRSAGGWTYDNGHYAEALRHALEVARYDQLRARQSQAQDADRAIGIGLCVYTEFTGMGPSRRMAAMGNRQGGYESAVVRLDSSGQVTVLSGVIELGQGIRASLAQVAAETLGTSPDRVRVVLGDTDLCPYSSYGTADSRGSVVGGAAVLLASRRLREKVAAVAAHLLEARADDIEVAGGRCVVRGTPARALSLGEVAREAYRAQRLPEGTEPGMEARCVFEPENWTFPYGVHVAAVEVDLALGAVTFLGYWVVHDCGRVINPVLVDGQLQGGIAQGVGAALLEELRYDESGQLLSGTFMDYLLPTACEVPAITLHHQETLSPTNPVGVKGMAEGGTIAAPAAVVNAIADALVRLHPGLDGAITSYPVGPSRIVEILRERAPAARSAGQPISP
jgi:carbon-monoxide dehydrogenase large subunit